MIMKKQEPEQKNPNNFVIPTFKKANKLNEVANLRKQLMEEENKTPKNNQNLIQYSSNKKEDCSNQNNLGTPHSV